MKNRNGMSVMKIPVPCGDEMVYPEKRQKLETTETS